MNKRQTIPFFASMGFNDADALQKRPTAPAILPIFGIDYALHNQLVTVDGLHIIPAHKNSDHDALAVTASIRKTD